MKRIKLLAVSAMVLAMGTALFANPKSNTKETTYDLFTDDVVDSIKEGVKDAKGLVAGSYGGINYTSHNFNIDAGMWITDNIWFNLFYSNSGKFTSNKERTDNFAYADDNLKVDTTKTVTKTDTWGDGTDPLTNNLSATVFLPKLNLGGELYWYGEYKTKNKKTTTDTDTQTTATIAKTVVVDNNPDYKNYVGINFTGLETAKIGKIGMVLGLNNVEATINNKGAVDKTTKTKTVYGEVAKDGASDADVKEVTKTSSSKVLGGSAKGFLEFDLPAVGLMSPTFKLEDTVGFYWETPSSKTNKITNVYNLNNTVNTKVEEKSVYGAQFEIINYAVPSLKCVFDAGENVKVAAKVNLPVNYTFTKNGYDYKKSTTTTTTDNLVPVSKEITNKYSETAIYDIDYIQSKISVNPEVDFGLVWAVKPSKVNINVGIAAKAGTLSWDIQDKTTSKKILETKETETDEFGVEVVKVNSFTSINGGADNTDSHSVKYSYSSANVEGRLGATVFLSENVALDTIVATGTYGFGLGSILNNTSIDLQLSVKF